MMRVAFVTHAGPAIGLGHVGRCLALGAAWATEGAELRFVLSPDGRARARLERAAAELGRRGARRTDVEEAAWETEPAAAREALGRFRPDVVVVDSYAASPDFLASLAEVTGLVVVVDDLADRELPAHMVVNGGIAAETLRYRARPDTVFLLGPRYALVDPRFAEAPARPVSTRVERVLVALGGGRHAPALDVVVDAVTAALPEASVDVVVGPFAPPDGEPGGAGEEARSRITVHRGPVDLRELMRAADVAVTGAGVTLYELAASGVPAAVVQTADNQGPNAAGFARAGAALGAGSAASPELGAALRSALGRLAADASLRASLAARARDLVDGAGAVRVIRKLAALAAGREPTWTR